MAQQDDVAGILEGLGLGQYAEAFRANAIGLTELRTLTSDDLRELGVAALGHRKAILAAIGAESPRAAPQRGAAPASNEEVDYLDAEVSLVKGNGRVRITNRRAILGDKTYALQNISAVEVRSNEEEVEAEYRAALARHENGKGGGVAMVLLLGVVSLATFNISARLGGFCLLFVIVGAFIVFAIQEKPTKGTIVWHVRIDASGSPTDLLTSVNRETVEQVAKALNDAIVNLRM
jgi:hypothetical protein